MLIRASLNSQDTDPEYQKSAEAASIVIKDNNELCENDSLRF